MVIIASDKISVHLKSIQYLYNDCDVCKHTKNYIQEIYGVVIIS